MKSKSKIIERLGNAQFERNVMKHTIRTLKRNKNMNSADLQNDCLRKIKELTEEIDVLIQELE